jgi:3-oxoacyl-[acyl-carrier protein] reductase
MSKVAVVTAGSRGIGAATARALGKAGYEVVVNYLKSKKDAEAVVAAIESAGGKAVAIQADACTPDGVQTLFSEVESRYKAIDVVVSNAAYIEETQFETFTHEEIMKNLNGNVAAAILTAQAAAPLMPQGGSLLFTSSIYGLPHSGKPTFMLYSMCKAAIITLAETLAERLAPQHIRCNVVAPGFTRTDAWEGASDEYRSSHLATTLQKEWVEPEEIAAAFVFLAQTPHMNGATIVVDGGWQKNFAIKK